MSKRSSLLFKSVLLILKNATIIIPLIEGVVYSIHDLLHPQLEKELKDVKAEEVQVSDAENHETSCEADKES